MAPISLPSSRQQKQRDTEVADPSSDNYPPSTILAKKRASVHIIEGSTSAKRISLLFKNSRCRSFSESWAFLSAASGVSPIDEREGLNNGTINIADNNNNAPSPSLTTLRLSPLRPTGVDCESASPSPSVTSITSSPNTTTTTVTAAKPLTPAAAVTVATETSLTSSSSSELPPSSLNLFRQPAVTGATAYEDLPDQELLKTLAAFLRGDSADQKSSRPSATSHSNQSSKDESEMCDLVVTVRDFAYPKSHPYHFGNYPPEPEYEESDIEEDEDYSDEADPASSYSSIGAGDDEGCEGEDRTEGYARGLYDFDAENSSELSFKEGEFVWIHCRQFPGWFLGEKDGAQGLVPENYVQLV
ncbi:HOG (high osmolarity glycerol) pathway protein [Mortierella sp. AD031]|nr:HOG (high osmolarity glycerol) pathway protein [Mortierella sp. AD031]